MRKIVVFTASALLLLGAVVSAATGWIPSLGAAPSLRFNGGVPSRGILMWAPAGVAPFGCQSNPSSCYTGGGGVATQLATAKLTVLCNAGIGHMRYGVDPTPMMVDPTNLATYVTSIFTGIDQILNNSCLKVIVNMAPNYSWSGYTPTDIQAGGPSGAKFLAYLTVLQAMANHVAANPSLYDPNRVAFSLLNENASANSITGGIPAAYVEETTMFSTVRAILPQHTIIACFVGTSGACSAFDTVNFAGWNAGDFDTNTVVDFHNYVPTAAAFAAVPLQIWRDVLNSPYPPAHSLTDYNTAVANYASTMAGDTTWGGDCATAGATFTGAISGTTLTTSGESGTILTGQIITTGAGVTANTFITGGSGHSWTVLFSQTVGSESMASTGGASCSGARASNINELVNVFTNEGLTCYYGEGSGGFPCGSGNNQNATWLATFLNNYVETWRLAVPGGVKANQIIIGEYGAAGVSSLGTGLSTSGQAQLLADYSGAVDALGYSRCVLEVSYSASGNGGSSFGLFNQSTPYAAVNASAITALGFNGQ